MAAKVNAPKGTELELDLVVAGIVAAIPSGATIVVDGVAYTQPDLLKKAQSHQGRFKALRDSRNVTEQRKLDVENDSPFSKRFLRELKIAVSAFLGSDNPDLTKFGYKPRKKPADLTVEQKALKAERARRTRGARHTMGDRQKKAIHGTPIDEVVFQDDASNGAQSTKKEV